MSRVFVCGLGAVSPAGWSVAALRAALAKGEPLPVQPLERPGWEKPLRARLVPPPSAKRRFLAHPRLRRTSPITHYAAAAALEAVAGLRPNSDDKPPAGRGRLPPVRLRPILLPVLRRSAEGPRHRQPAAVSRDGLRRASQPCRRAAWRTRRSSIP